MTFSVKPRRLQTIASPSTILLRDTSDFSMLSRDHTFRYAGCAILPFLYPTYGSLRLGRVCYCNTPDCFGLRPMSVASDLHGEKHVDIMYSQWQLHCTTYAHSNIYCTIVMGPYAMSSIMSYRYWNIHVMSHYQLQYRHFNISNKCTM